MRRLTKCRSYNPRGSRVSGSEEKEEEASKRAAAAAAHPGHGEAAKVNGRIVGSRVSESSPCGCLLFPRVMTQFCDKEADEAEERDSTRRGEASISRSSPRVLEEGRRSTPHTIPLPSSRISHSLPEALSHLIPVMSTATVEENGNDKTVEDREGPAKRKSENETTYFFSGAIAEAKQRFPYYKSDFTDVLEYRCGASIIFMFLACIAPTITFGGLMGKYTDEVMGTTETLLAQAMCGLIWGLFSCQPIIIQSITGPVLIFEASLYRLCKSLELDLLTVRVIAGWWMCLICFATVALNGSRLSSYVTRFTDEIFAVLISGIFIFESLNFVRKTNDENPVEDYNFYWQEHLNCNASVSMRPCHNSEPNTTLLTGIIMFTTFATAYTLYNIQRSNWFGKHIRNVFGDFGVFIAISVVAGLTYLLFPDPILARLEMPVHLNFTNLQKRGHGVFIIPDFSDSRIVLSTVIAAFAALLVFILIFVETEITELLLGRKERGLVKGGGLNWDLCLTGVCSLLCSILGLPWMCAGAVQSLAHCSSLTLHRKDKINPKAVVVDRVLEQRVTTIAVSLCIGAFAFLGSYLRLPMASLFGVFLYLGVMNLHGIQLVRRTLLFLVPVKYHPSVVYTKSVGVGRMRLYTWIQLALVVVIMIVKQIQLIALAFPFVLILFVIFRYTLIPLIFTKEELESLDNEHEDIRESASEDTFNCQTDVYAAAHNIA